MFYSAFRLLIVIVKATSACCGLHSFDLRLFPELLKCNELWAVAGLLELLVRSLTLHKLKKLDEP